MDLDAEGWGTFNLTNMASDPGGERLIYAPVDQSEVELSVQEDDFLSIRSARTTTFDVSIGASDPTGQALINAAGQLALVLLTVVPFAQHSQAKGGLPGREPDADLADAGVIVTIVFSVISFFHRCCS